jgi:predicted AlkP superfamily phosphohydrolase/phosphomutase
MKKLLIIGIDGLSPQLLQLLINKKIFKFIGQLKASGIYRPLASTIPPTTAPAWASFATGVNPGQHGIFNFIQPKKSLTNLEPVSTADIKTKTFYQLLDKKGLKTILINLPVSWPPLTQQPTITSLLTQSDNPIYPENLTSQFPILKHYQITPPGFGRHRRYRYGSKFVAAVRRNEHLRFKTSLQLLSLNWDLFFVLFSGTDWLCHHIYRQLLTGQASPEVWRYFADLDHYVKTLHQQAAAELIILSDHGFQTINHQFSLNHWLKLNRWLKIHYQPLFRFAVDPHQTLAWSDGWSIYLNAKPRFNHGLISAAKRLPLAKKILSQLKKIIDPKTKQKVFKQVLLREQVYQGKQLKQAPDIILIPRPHWQINAQLYPRPIFSHHQRNDHHPQGIFITQNSNIVKPSALKNLSLADLAPNLLAFFRP